MSIIVTGAAGFIGCNNILALNAAGETDVIAVDNLENGSKFENLAKCKISDYIDKREFIEGVRQKKYSSPELIIHEGACTNTMGRDGKYMMENNYRYTLELFRWAQDLQIPFIYASSATTYGDRTEFIEDPAYEHPINVFGYSKYLFDQVLRREMNNLKAPAIGLRYFTVYGPNEQHKGAMASVAYHHYFQYRRNHKVQLFEGCQGYGNGAQMRDFVYIKDVNKVLMHFINKPISGIYNLGTGRAQSFNDMGLAVINALRQHEGKEVVTLEQAVQNGEIEYIPFPDELKGRYQAYTQANLDKLRLAGCDVRFSCVEEGTADYVHELLQTYPTV